MRYWNAADQLWRKRHVAGEDCANAGVARGFEEREDFRQDVRAVFDLRNDADLHVVDQKGGALRVYQLPQRGEDFEAIVRGHDLDCLCSMRFSYCSW